MNMNLFNPEIKLEKQLQAQIYNALEGDIVSFILKNAGDTPEDIYIRSEMEGSAMKVDQDVMGDFYALCQDVKQRLGFKDPVDFYIQGSPVVNAFSIAAKGEGVPHSVVIYSGLYNLMNDDELRFIVGHELGHLINHDTALGRLIRFVYPPRESQMPLTLDFKVRIHSQLAELVADRYGFLACGNLEACVTGFYKLTSGIDLIKLGVSIEDLFKKNDQALDFFLHGGGISDEVHPVHPIRIQAIKLFARAKSDKELEDGMNELIQILLKSGSNPMDPPMSIFIATAGIIAASADGQVSKEEYEHIVRTLASSHIFPSDFVENIAHENVDKLFTDSVNALLEADPNIRPTLLQYMLEIIMADKDIHEKEVNFIYDFGQRMGLSIKDISQIFAVAIQRQFTPSLSALA